MNDAKPERISPAMLTQLIAYAEEAAYDGWYYGPEEQFIKRHGKIMRWLRALQEKEGKL